MVATKQKGDLGVYDISSFIIKTEATRICCSLKSLCLSRFVWPG